MCTVCNAYAKAFNAYLEAMKSMRDLQKHELDAHLKALGDISASREDHLISHPDVETGVPTHHWRTDDEKTNS